MTIHRTYNQLKCLDFDIENRPLSYWYPGECTAEITAIAWSWVGSDMVYCRLLGSDALQVRDLLQSFLPFYNEADMVTGHYIRKHDLPIINGACMENSLPPLSAKLTHDTKLDLVKKAGLPASQEALAAMFGLDQDKVHMTQDMWRRANRLSPEGFELTRKRVTQDVVQNKALRKELLNRGLLKQPRIWRP